MGEIFLQDRPPALTKIFGDKNADARSVCGSWLIVATLTNKMKKVLKRDANTARWL